MMTLDDIYTKLNDNLQKGAPLLAGIETRPVPALVEDLLPDPELTRSEQTITAIETSVFLDVPNVQIEATITELKDSALILERRFIFPDGHVPFLSLLPVKVPLTEVTLHLTTRGLGTELELLTAAISANISLEPVPIPIIVRLPAGSEEAWLLEGNFENLTLEAMANVVEADAGWPAILRPLLKSVGDPSFTRISIIFTPSPLNVSRISLTLATSQPLAIIPEKLVIRAVQLYLTIFDPADKNRMRISGTIVGTIGVGDLDIDVTAEFPDYRFYGSLAEGASLNLTDIVQGLLPGDVHLPAGAPDIVLHDLNIMVDVPTGSFAVYARCFSDWEVIKGVSLTAVQIDAGLTRAAPDAGEAEKFATITGAFNVAGVDIIVSADHPGADFGWQFEGRSGPGQKIEMSHLISWLEEENRFGKLPPLPDVIQNFSIQDLQVSFNTKSKDFTFACTGNIHITVKPLKATFTVDIRHQQNGEIKKHFSGSVLIGGVEFDLIFESSGKAGGDASNIFLAAYHYRQDRERPSAPPGIRDLIGVFSSNLAEIAPDITTKAALLIYDAAHSRWLFGIDIEAGINLSHIELHDLPLIGDTLSPDQSLILSLQVFVPNKEFTEDDIKVLNPLVAERLRLPEKALADVDLAVSLEFGRESRQLSLPIGLDKNPKKGQSGLVDLNTTDLSKVAASAVVEKPESDVTADKVQWIKIQKSFGPVHMERVGIGFTDDGEIEALLDAALTAGGLTIALQGLSVRSPIDKFKPEFSLDGLGIDYRSGPVEIGGAFLKQALKTKEGINYTAFAGLAVIRTAKLTLSAVGSYTSVAGEPSMFIYAVLDYPLGGPSFFFITGLAAGFGYNRSLIMPEIEQVKTFPLVKQVIQENGPTTLPASLKAQQETLTGELANLEHYITPTVGQHFLAIGIKFTSFKIIDSFALLVVQFGEHFEIDLLGVSTLISPPIPGTVPVAKAQLALKATFKPAEGTLKVLGQLTAGSYILAENCHLTGGFAFYCWFKDQPGIRAGDFVLTLGGYHSQFKIPAHYPRVPRLGFHWQVSPQLTIKGDGYFALTAHAVMAGAHLEALWHSDNLQAWIKAGADFLISWQPYHYDAQVYIDIGASYTFDVLGYRNDITFELGADLHLWGPPFSGEATIHYYIISFTIGFGGDAPRRLKKVGWSDFRDSFLPHSTEETEGKKQDDPVCSVAVQSGLVRQIEEAGQQRWILNAKEFVLVTNTAVPVKEVKFGEQDIDLNSLTNEKIGSPSIRPVGVFSDGWSSGHNITIMRDGEDKPEPPDGHFVITPILKDVPAGLWGKPEMDGEFLKRPEPNEENPMVQNTVAGFEIRPAALPDTLEANCIDRANLRYEIEELKQAFAWETAALTPVQGTTAWEEAQDSIVTHGERDKLLKILGFPATAVHFGGPIKEDTLLPKQDLKAQSKARETR